MKHYLIILIALFSGYTVGAQSITVSEMDQTVDKIRRTGLGTTLQLDKKLVKDLWVKQLKKYGKVKTSGSMITLESASIPSVSSRNVRVVGMVTGSGKGATAWWAIDLGDKWVTKGGTGYNAASKILHDFGVNAYREDINDQIEDAQKALEKVVKEQEKTVKHGEHLVHELKKNGEEKIQLEESLKKNGEEKITLQKDIEQNKKDQESMKQKVAEYQKAVDVVKAKLDKVH